MGNSAAKNTAIIPPNPNRLRMRSPVHSKNILFTSCFQTSIEVKKRKLNNGNLPSEGIPMPAVIRVEQADVNSRLDQLGLTQEVLQEAVRRGQYAFITCTANHPPMVPGIWAWGETVRGLRERLLPLGWERSNENNYSVIVSPSKQCAIAVCAGDEGTGRADAVPSNKAPKGPSTLEAVITNQSQLSLFLDTHSQPVSVRDDKTDERVTWILLVYRGTEEVRFELSLPSSIGVDGRIDDWQERILVGVIPLENEPVELEPPTQPDIAVDVKRKV